MYTAPEFTGERVVPGEVDVDLWNEHLARYAFAARLSRSRVVVEAGCGSGYGAAELAACAARVIATDVAHQAVEYAARSYSRPNLRFVQASAASLPIANASADLVIAFEVIEHVPDWRQAILEAKRVLKPGGQFVVSTPNKLYYAESRQTSGPNPYHDHEFEYAEFRDELSRVFPHVSMFVQNHSHGIVFRPAETAAHAADVRMPPEPVKPEESHFFIAVCASVPQTGAPTFIYLPRAANVLRERERHIHMLEDELATKNRWLDEARREHESLVELFRRQTAELESRNQWAAELDAELKQSLERIAALQIELEDQQRRALDVAQNYEQALAQADAEKRALAEHARATEARLTADLQAVAADLRAKCDELARCVELLDAAEQTIRERTEWAQRADAEAGDYRSQLAFVQASRWVKLGRAIGLGPQLRNL